MANRRADVIAFDGGPTGSRFRWLYEQLRSALLEGRLAAGSRMPSTRALSQSYAVARGTVVEVFDQLTAEGYLQARRGSGTFVAASLPDRWFEAKATVGIRGAPMPQPHARLSTRGLVLARGFAFPSGRHPRAFQAHRPALDRTSISALNRIAGQRRFDDPAYAAHNDARGYRPLRAAIAEYLARMRGVRCNEDQVLIFSGVLSALDITTRLVADAGDSAALEDPGYDGARRVFEANGLHVRSLPVDDEGATFTALARDGLDVRLVFITPGHQ